MIQFATMTVGDKQFIRTWSDKSLMIERDGTLYEEAIDPIDSGRIYTESHQSITLPDVASLLNDRSTAL